MGTTSTVNRRTNTLRWVLVVAGLLIGGTGVVSAETAPRPEPRPADAVLAHAIERAHGHLDRMERALAGEPGVAHDVGLTSDDAIETRTARLRTLRFLRRELGKLGPATPALHDLLVRIHALSTRIGGDVRPEMAGGGSIAGTVRAQRSGQPIPGVDMVLYRAGDDVIMGTLTAVDGEYRFANLGDGSYRLQTLSPSPFIDEVWDDLSCASTCFLSDGDPVVVEDGAEIVGIDFDLAQRGEIGGTVRDAETGFPIPFVELRLDGVDNGNNGFTMSDVDGMYTFGGVDTGAYVVFTRSIVRYLDQVYDGLPCYQVPGFECDPSLLGTPITVDDGAFVAGIDFNLEPGARLRGTVRSADTGGPIPETDIVIYDAEGRDVQHQQTDDDGAFAFRALPAGTYYALATFNGASPFVNALFGGVLCAIPPNFGGCDPRDGTPIVVTDNEIRDGVDFALVRRGAVAGRVTDAATAQPIGGVRVEMIDRFNFGYYSGLTDPDGTYRFDNVPPTTYQAVVTGENSPYLGEVFDGIDCRLDCLVSAGTPFAVDVDTTTTGIDFTLERGGSIVGRVTDEITGAAISGANVRLDRPNGSTDSQFTGPDGRYGFERLEAGNYNVIVIAAAPGYLTEAWGGLHCTSVFDCQGDAIAVANAQAVTGIDVSLDVGGVIRGTVTDAETGDAPRVTFVRPWDSANVEGNGDVTTDGTYTLARLLPGSYRVTAGGFNEYREIAWPQVPCPDTGCDGSQGDLITIGLGDVVESIDFVLEPIGCQPTESALCLNNQRFRVLADWRTPQGDTGRATAVELTDESGYLWFFREDNVEAVVKVIDACGTSFERFWVFAAGLTNVEVVLRVTDTWTGMERVYTNPLGTAFAPIQDTQAFATCQATPPTSVVQRLDSSLVRGAPGASAETPDEVVEPKGLGCSGQFGVLCLNSGRFAVRTRWQTDSAAGTGEPVDLTADTGTFWFFNPENTEIVVKVIDACSSSFNRFWVFASGLTNVGVELEVTDTQTGEVRIYTNPRGTPFQPIVDTQAFDTCP